MMVFAGKWRMADVRRGPRAGGGDDGDEGGRCPNQLMCRLFFAANTRILVKDNFYERTWYGLRSLHIRTNS